MGHVAGDMADHAEEQPLRALATLHHHLQDCLRGPGCEVHRGFVSGGAGTERHWSEPVARHGLSLKGPEAAIRMPPPLRRSVILLVRLVFFFLLCSFSSSSSSSSSVLSLN